MESIRDEQPPKKKGSPFLRGLGRVLREIGHSAPEMQAMMNGDYSAAARFREMHDERHGKETESKRVGELQRQAFDYLVRTRGVDPRQAMMMVQDVKSLATEWNTQERTRDLAPGHTVRNPNGETYTAPKTFENGPNVYEYDPQAGPPQLIFQGQTDAQRAVEESGYEPGSPQAFNFLRDYHLDGQGPTAVQMQQSQLGVQRRGQDMGAETARRGQDVSRTNSERAAGTARYNRDNTPVSRVVNERGEVVVTYANGRVQTLRNSRPMSPSRGGRAGRAGGSGRGGGVAEGTVIRNPTTGQTMVRRGGQWVAQR